MKNHLQTATAATLGIIAMLAFPAAAADENGESDLSASVLEAIREFNERAKSSPNEVLVVLDPPESDDAEEPDEVIAAILADEPESDQAEATNGENEPPDDEDHESESATDAAAGPSTPRGPQVRVQSLRDTQGTDIRAEDITISTPFAAKPLGSPPAGWKLISSSDVAEFTEDIEVTPGTWLTLSIRPHVLIPEADGRNTFHIAEPGFDPALGYQQQDTINSSISSSLRQLEQDARVLGQVIDDLEQILISLPRSDNLDSNNEEINE